MGILDAAKKVLGLVAPAVAQELEDKKRARYFLQLVKAGEVWPEKEWDEARLAYEADTAEGKRPRVSRWRSTVDIKAAFVDEEPPKVNVEPRAGMAGDMATVNRAKADEALYAYLYDELGYRATIGKMRHSADVTGLGWVVCCTDTRRVMPDLKFIQNEQVALDGNGGGNLKRLSWIAYYELVAPELLQKEFPDLNLEKARTAAQTPRRENLEGTSEDIRRVQQAMDATRTMESKCKVWRIFLRNEAALYDTEPSKSEEGQPHLERFRDREGMNEPRRHVVVVEGYETLLRDEDRWPDVLACDWDEWPIHRLAFNEAYERTSGFTDYRHEEKLLGYIENAMADANDVMALHTSLKIGAARGDMRDAQTIKNSIEAKGIQVIPDAFDEQGRPLLQPLNFGNLDQQHLNWIELCERTYETVSGVPKVQQGSENDTQQTATEIKVMSDAANARMDVRLHKFEEANALVAAHVLMMAHVLLKRGSSVEVVEDVEGVDPKTGAPTMVQQARVVDGLSWDQAQVAIMQGGTLITMGVDAMIGSELAAFWEDGLPLDIIRRNIRVSVEKGSTQRRARMEKVSMFLQTYMGMVDPILMQLGMTRERLEAAKKVMEMQGLGDLKSIVPDIPVPAALGVGPGAGSMPAEAVNAPV